MIRFWSMVAAAMPGGSSPGPTYEVYAVEYARLVGFGANNLVLGADSARKVDGSMMVWVIKGEGRVILVDAGFYRQEFLDSWKKNVADYVKPSVAVAKLGIKPEQVTDIIISHLHWDHADGADLFPKARVWVQRAEYEHYRVPANRSRTGVFQSDIDMFGRIAADGRLHLVDGDAQTITKGITVYIGGRHTKESQYVSVPVKSGVVVLASDNLYLYENLERHRPIAATWDTVSNLAAQSRMVTIAGGARLIVPGHDRAVFKRFPLLQPGIARIE